MANKDKKEPVSGPCEMCVNFVYDDDDECYYCDVNLDEDDMYKFLTGDTKGCSFFQMYDEYKIVRHQM
ncbi:MAG: DUF6472 family protein [Lachnospiraceae bacterium]|nr:DUF6472 family protein [Lachnospiraceae bacterium]